MQVTATLRVTALMGLLLTAALSFRPAADAQAAEASLVVVVAQTWPVRDIAFATLKRAYRGEVTELAGERLQPVNYNAKDPLRQTFDLRVLGSDPDVISRYWTDRRLRGQGFPPPVVANGRAVRAWVTRLPNAIGYMSPKSVDSSLRILTIDGKAYTDPEYPLH